MPRLCLSPKNQEACIPAYIVVPNNTPESKIHECNNRRVSYSEPTTESRKSTTAKVSAETRVLFIPSSNDARIIRGAFKFRGASNVVLSLDNQQVSNGVVTHSSGNLAAALLLAAQSRGIPAYIVVPNNAPKCKVRNIERYGGHVSYSKPTIESRMSTAADVLEIKVVAIAAKAIKPEIKVVAAEPIGANDAALSKANGTLTTIPETNTIADGLGASLGDLTWPILRDFVDEVVTVEDDIIDAMGLCNDILKIVVEPSGAIGLAPVCKIRNIEGYEGHVSYSKPTMESRMSTAAEVSELNAVTFSVKLCRLLSRKITVTNNNGNIKYAADLSSIKEARERISSVIHRTPVFSSKSLNGMSGKSVLFKCKCFQTNKTYIL